jgi:hypothetical protein
MITSLEIVDILWAKLNGSPLKAAIDGGIYKNRRPASSEKQDVVINCLPVNNQQLQTTIANVNIHVPNISIDVNGVQDSSQPDHVKLLALSKIAVGVLKDIWSGDYNFNVQQEVLIQDEEQGDYYINIRIEFYNINN